jgi:HEPN domain-containing protein
LKDPQRDAGRWLAEAEVDLNLSERIAGEFPARACFHAQQAGEKALKAILYAAGQPVVRVAGEELIIVAASRPGVASEECPAP